jgi:putative Holliday junction resolvase
MPDSPPVGKPDRAEPRPPRYAGIDYGARRIGLALADPGGRIASPVGAIDGSGSPAADAAHVRAWAAREAVSAFVVGLPLNMDGSDGAQTRVARTFAAALAGEGARVELWDERLTSFQADALLGQLDEARGRRIARTRKGDPRRDAVAAQIILQSFLDARRRSD